MLEIRRTGSILVLLASVFFVGCGGAASDGGGGGTTTQAQAPQGQDDPSEGGRRRAREGARCDYGGAADLTCQRGLYCCYGPPENPGTHGECMPSCPE